MLIDKLYQVFKCYNFFSYFEVRTLFFARFIRQYALINQGQHCDNYCAMKCVQNIDKMEMEAVIAAGYVIVNERKKRKKRYRRSVNVDHSSSC